MKVLFFCLLRKRSKYGLRDLKYRLMIDDRVRSINSFDWLIKYLLILVFTQLSIFGRLIGNVNLIENVTNMIKQKLLIRSIIVFLYKHINDMISSFYQEIVSFS